MVALDDKGEPMNSGDRLVTKCPNGSFCCKDMNSTCCDDGDGLWIDTSNFQLRTYDPTKTTISSSSSSLSASTASLPSTIPAGAITAAPSIPSATTKPSSTSTGAIAGGVVGGVGGLAVISGLLFFLYRKRKPNKIDMLDSEDSSGQRYHEASGNIMTRSVRAEKDGTELVEMDGNELRSRNVELEGSPLVEGRREYYKPREENDQHEVHEERGEYKTHIAENLALANDDGYR